MKRNEYKLLVENWNNYLLQEEKRLMHENMLIESFLLNEINIKKLATKLKTSVPALVLFLAAKAANASPGEVADDPSLLGSGVNSGVEKIVNDVGEEDIDNAEALAGSLTTAGANRLVGTIVYGTGQGEGDYNLGTRSGTISGEIAGRTISQQEQEVISLLKLFDNDEKAFLKAIKNDKNKSLLCSYGYCFSQWKEKNANKYSLFSSLGYEFKDNASGVDEIPKGKAVSLHNRLYSPPSDDYIKNLTSRYQKLSRYEDKKLKSWGMLTNKIVKGYKQAWQAARKAKIQKASETFPKLFKAITSGENITNLYDENVTKNHEAWFSGLKSSWIKTIEDMQEEGFLSSNNVRSLVNRINNTSGIEDLEEIFDEINKLGLENIFGTGDLSEIADMYSEVDI